MTSHICFNYPLHSGMRSLHSNVNSCVSTAVLMNPPFLIFFYPTMLLRFTTNSETVVEEAILHQEFNSGALREHSDFFLVEFRPTSSMWR